jgi:hypothetical protein
MMKVTEHNITEWKLTDVEISELIRLTKDQMKNADDKVSELFYGMIVGKLLIMKNE